MEATNLSQQKISIAQTIFALKDRNLISHIQSYIDGLVQNVQEVDSEFDAKLLTFEKWNEQFEDEYKLDDFIHDYDMTVREFRLKIYNSERGKGMSKQDFFKKINDL